MKATWSCTSRSVRHAFVWRICEHAVDATLTILAFAAMGRWAAVLFAAALAASWWRMYLMLTEEPLRFEAITALDETAGRSFAKHIPRPCRILLLLIVPGLPTWLLRHAIVGFRELSHRYHPLHVRVAGGRLFVYDDSTLESARALFAEGPFEPETARDAILSSIIDVHDRPHTGGLTCQES